MSLSPCTNISGSTHTCPSCFTIKELIRGHEANSVRCSLPTILERVDSAVELPKQKARKRVSFANEHVVRTFNKSDEARAWEAKDYGWTKGTRLVNYDKITGEELDKLIWENTARRAKETLPPNLLPPSLLAPSPEPVLPRSKKVAGRLKEMVKRVKKGLKEEFQNDCYHPFRVASTAKEEEVKSRSFEKVHSRPFIHGHSLFQGQESCKRRLGVRSVVF